MGDKGETKKGIELFTDVNGDNQSLVVPLREGKGSVMSVIMAIKAAIRSNKYIYGFSVSYRNGETKSYFPKRDPVDSRHLDVLINPAEIRRKHVTPLFRDNSKQDGLKESTQSNEQHRKTQGAAAAGTPTIHLHINGGNQKTWAAVADDSNNSRGNSRNGSATAAANKPRQVEKDGSKTGAAERGRASLSRRTQPIFDRFKTTDTIPSTGILGLSADETLAEIIHKHGCDEDRIKQDIASWKQGSLVLNQKAAPLPPKKAGGDVTASCGDAVKTVAALLNKVSQGTLTEADRGQLLELFKLVDNPDTRQKAKYAIHKWVVIKAPHLGKNLCWLSSALQGAAGVKINQEGDFYAMVRDGVRPFAEKLLADFSPEDLYNLFLSRYKDEKGLMTGTGSQLSDLDREEDGPAKLAAILKQIVDPKNTEMGGPVHHIVLATLLQCDIHVHTTDYIGESASLTEAASLSARWELVVVYSPVGMKRGEAGREVHVVHTRSPLHFDTVLGAADAFLKEKGDRDPKKLLTIASEYIARLAKDNSEEQLKLRLGDRYDPSKHRPILMRTSVVDLTGGRDKSHTNRRQSTTAQNADTLASLVKQVSALAEAVSALVGSAANPNRARVEAERQAETGRQSADDASAERQPTADAAAERQRDAAEATKDVSPRANGETEDDEEDENNGNDAADTDKDAGDNATTGPRGGGNTGTAALAQHRADVQTALTNLLEKAGDDLCKEHVLQLTPKSLCESENRKVAVAECLRVASQKLDSAISATTQGARTRAINIVIARIAAYVTGHVKFSDKDSVNVLDPAVSDVLAPAAQLNVFESFIPLLKALNPTFQLTEAVLTHTKYFDKQTAPLLLSRPSSAGSQ